MAKNPHTKYRNSLKLHGKDYVFFGCERDFAIQNQNVIDIVKTVLNSKSYNLLDFPFLLSIAVQEWEYERELYTEAERLKAMEGKK